MSGLAALADKAFGFKGRLRRRDLWLISLGLGVVAYVLQEWISFSFGAQYSLIGQAVNTAILSVEGGSNAPPVLPSRPVALIAILTGIGAILLWSNLAMATKRLHDQGKSAKLALVATAILFNPVPMTEINSAIVSASPVAGSVVSWLVSVVGMVALLYWFVVVGVLEGTRGPNRYGPSPKGLEFAKVSE